METVGESTRTGMDYWDTSCVLKLYCGESNSDRWLDEIAAASDPPCSSELLETELHFAFLQKAFRDETGGVEPDALSRRFRADVECGRVILLPLGNDVLCRSREIGEICYRMEPPIHLRTLDGLHLATAELGRCRRLMSTDMRMRSAARHLGLDI